MNAVTSPPSIEFGVDSNFIVSASVVTLFCLGVGFYYWFYYRVTTTPSDTPTRYNGSPNERIAAFVEYEISSNEIVLFVVHEKYIEPFQTLFDALKVNFHLVNLSTIAGKKRILTFLYEKYYQNNVKQNEFLFVNGNFVGGFKTLRHLVINGKKKELGIKGDWTSVHVDNKTKTGFHILDKQHGFQQVQNGTNDRFIALETRPLYTVDELRHFDTARMVRCSVPIASYARKQCRRSKLLVCHDMKGGYQEDRFKQGCDDFHAYRFYQWDLVDTFVYFAHALVCPPPTGWIIAGHCHGTPVLGTFLTEGEQGTKLCKELFHDAHLAEVFASKLAAIACHGGFDGWLINLENDVPVELVTSIDVFLRTLRKKMRCQNPLAQVVWYGSLSRCGKRGSHVRLDEASADFFRIVDAFYADYGWVSEDAKLSAAFDLDRRYAVYMGIDVFGRHNTLGGGKMNCGEPLRLAWNSGVSAALFAPGWTHECYQHEVETDFVVVENRFWQAIRDSWKVKSPCYDALGGRNCLYSAFNIGRGVGVWAEGKRVSTSTWSNMSEMDIQPDQALHVGNVLTTATGSMKAVITHDTAFQGGACVQVQGHLVEREKSYFKLFDVDIEFSPRRIMEVSYTTATREDSVCLLVLTVCPGLHRATHYVILCSTADSSLDARDNRVEHKIALSAVAKATLEKHFYLPVFTEHFDVEGVNAEVVGGTTTDGWCKKTYCLGGQLWAQKHIVEIGVLCTKRTGQAPDDCGKYLANIGEVCVVGNNNENAVYVAHCGVHSQPKRCENMRITSFWRHNADLVSFGVQWDYAVNGAPVRYALMFVRTHDSMRVFVGKSFDNSLQVDKCMWHQGLLESKEGVSPPSSSRLTIELQSISWTGQSSNSISVLHLEE